MERKQMAKEMVCSIKSSGGAAAATADATGSSVVTAPAASELAAAEALVQLANGGPGRQQVVPAPGRGAASHRASALVFILQYHIPVAALPTAWLIL